MAFRCSAWVAIGALAVVFGCTTKRQDPARPNVLVISLDTTRASSLGYQGYNRPTTPTLDGFAASAIVFQSAYSVSTWTAPAHATLFSGLYPTEHGCHADFFAAAEEALPIRADTEWLIELFEEKGYATLGVTAGPYLDASFGFGRAFDRYDDDLPDLGLRSATEVNAIAVPWIQKRVGRGEPFFAFLNYFDPHGPYEPDPALEYPFGDPDPVSSPYHAFSPGAAKSRGEDLPPESDVNTIIDLYDQEIFAMDHHLSRLLDTVREDSVWNNTVIVFVGDHGEAFGDRIDGAPVWGHGTYPLESVSRIPLMIKPKGAAQTRVIREPVSTVHLARTIAALTGLDASVFPGVNLCDDASRPDAEPVFAERYYPGRWVSAVWNGRFKLLREYGAGIDGFSDLLCDIESSPRERVFRLVGRERILESGENPELEEALRVARSLRATYERFLELRRSFNPEPVPRKDGAEISKELEDQLRRLGYLDAEEDNPESVKSDG